MKLLRAISSGSGSAGPGGAVNELTKQDVVALNTVSDFDPATASGIVTIPLGAVAVFINGSEIEIGNGVKTKEAYFSSDAGITAKAINGVAVGDILYWVGSVAGYQLEITDKIRYLYAIA